MSSRRSLAVVAAALFSLLLIARLPASIATALAPPTVIGKTPQARFGANAAHVQLYVAGQWFALGNVDWRYTQWAVVWRCAHA